MSSFWADPANAFHTTKTHPALTSFADEICATVARLFAYVGTLALLAILAVHGWDQMGSFESDATDSKAGWNVADRSYPAFAISQTDPSEKSGTYTILRHPAGGRRDIFRWGAGEKPVTELEIYRLGDEFDPTKSPIADLAARMGLRGASELETAGVIESKFGSISLFRQTGAKDVAGDCLGFFKSIGEPGLRISGFSCQGDGLPARRATVGCELNRLILLTSGNEPKLAELFAHAELRRGSCVTEASTAASADWMTTAQNPQLRGPF